LKLLHISIINFVTFVIVTTKIIDDKQFVSNITVFFKRKPLSYNAYIKNVYVNS